MLESGYNILDMKRCFNGKVINEELKNEPVLIGFSGGPDSVALLHTLQTSGFNQIHLVHIDHGWREESQREAVQIKEMARRQNLSVHIFRLEPPKKGNLENWCRNERIRHFKQVYDEIGAKALFLGHQLDDYAETVLKRVFEGAYFPHINSPKFESVQWGMTICRPLLGMKKEEILALGLEFFDDPTNRDPKYLRARMRLELIPILEEHFGKGVRGNLVRLGIKMGELDHYLSRRVERWNGLVKQGKICTIFDFSHEEGLEPVEVEHFFKNQLNVALSHVEWTNLVRWVVDRSGGKELISCEIKLFFHRGVVVVVKKGDLSWSRSDRVSGGWVNSYGESVDEGAVSGDWKAALLGEVVVWLGDGDYEVRPRTGRVREGVPAFAKEMLPAVWQAEEQVIDFLNIR
ncbi:MAG: tRNA(Ile)-lysidine synthase [Chlamydiia bacterium]|nr:tRNA(Ile)-lysidine synthase [Chlamydiia bacterium]